MKHFRPVLATLIIALSVMWLVEPVASNTESESSSDRLVRGILITLDDVDRPACSTSIQGFVYDDGEETTVCMDNQWQTVVIDADGDGHVKGTDEDDNDASDNGDSDLVPANIKSGVDIFDVEGTLVVSSVVDNDADGITSTLDEDDNDATDKGDSDLIANNIRGGIDIFGVLGSLTERGNFSIAATTPSASTQKASVRVPAGVYDGDESVTHKVRGDSDLIPGNIRGGIDIFGVLGNLTERGNFSIAATTPSASTQTASVRVPAGVYDGGESVTHVVQGDSDLIANNIRGGIRIFNVMGNLDERDSVSLPETTPGSSDKTITQSIPRGVYDGDESVSHVVKGDSDLVAANIKSGVDIFDIEGTLVVSSVVDNDADGITSTLDEDDNDATDKGDSNLVPANIKSGVRLFGVTGTYPTSREFPPYLTVSAGYNEFTGYGLRVDPLAGHAYCKGRGKDEMISYATTYSRKGVGIFFLNNRITVTQGSGGGYSTFETITCRDLNL